MEETSLPYERVLTDISTGAQKAPEFLKINPMGKAPALKDGDVALGEAAALDAELQKGPWILGDQFSAADIVIGAGLNFAVRLFKMVPSRPSFDAYIERCVARPAFQRAEKIAAG